MYAKCGSLNDSQLLFERMSHRNIVSFNALISTYSRVPHHSYLAFKLLTQLENELLKPNGSTFTSLLQASSSLEDKSIGSALHGQIIKVGFTYNLCIQTALLGMYSTHEDLKSTEKVFTDIEYKDSVAWNSLISGFLKNDKIVEGLWLFDSMMRSDKCPTQFTYSMVLNACSKLGIHNIGKLVHARFILSNNDTPSDLPLVNALLDMYSSCGDNEMACTIFSRIENPDLISWNSIISGYSEYGDGGKAVVLFIQLKKSSSLKPDQYTYTTVINAVGDFPSSYYGKPLHSLVQKTGFEKYVFVGSAIVSMYFKNSESDAAEKVFTLILNKDAVLWTDMIVGYSRLEDGESALKFYYKMWSKGYKIDGFSISSALSACADLLTIKQGEMIHSQAIKTGFSAGISVSGSLIDMYAKNGDLRASESVHVGVLKPDLKCWNSMLGGYCHHGKVKEALKLFDELSYHGLNPDDITFISLLSACSHSGLVEKGKLLWSYMFENGFLPGIKHYSCMISLLSRAGLLEEAEELITESPFSDCIELWRTLLSSCVINRNLRIGIRAAEKILMVDEDDSSTLILLSNLYAVEGKWDGVVEVRRKLRGNVVEKETGLSWIEVMNDIHSFSSGDQLHPVVSKAEEELHRLKINMTVFELDEILT